MASNGARDVSGEQRADRHPAGVASGLAGRGLAQTAEQMSDAFTHLQVAVTSGSPWGGDETGTLFAGIYNTVLGARPGGSRLLHRAGELRRSRPRAKAVARRRRHRHRRRRTGGQLRGVRGGDDHPLDEPTEPLSWLGLVLAGGRRGQPDADGRAWIDYGGKLRAQAEQAAAAARQAWPRTTATRSTRLGAAGSADGPGHHLDDAANVVELIGAALVAIAGVTIALKTAFIAQRSPLAIEVGQAIAIVTVSFGVTLAESRSGLR